MNQHARDRFGSEASRGQDAVPIDQAVEEPAGAGEPQRPQQPEHLDELRALGARHNSGATNSTSETASESVSETVPESAASASAPDVTNAAPSNTEMRARARRAAQAARTRETREQIKHRHAPMNPGEALHTLADQGFTEGEAVRLLTVTERWEESAEAREAEAILQRLRFTRWLVEQGKLDEWSE